MDFKTSAKDISTSSHIQYEKSNGVNQEVDDTIDASSKTKDIAALKKENTGLNLDMDSDSGFRFVMPSKGLRSKKMMEKFLGNSKCSEDMNHVRTALEVLDNVLKCEYDSKDTQKSPSLQFVLNRAEMAYIYAIEKCSVYLTHKDQKWFYSQDRYNAVKRTRDMLEKELGYLSELRRNREVIEKSNFDGKVSILDLIYDSEKKEKNADTVDRLGIEDFIKVSSDVDSDSVVCRNGKLCKLSEDDLFRDSQLIPTKENYQMILRFITVLLEKQKISSNTTKKKITINLLLWLGADMENLKSGPVKLELLREVIRNSKMKFFDVDTVLENQERDKEEYRIAEQINRLLGKSPDKDGMYQVLEQLQQIQGAGAKSDQWKTPDLDANSIDQLLNGSLEIVRNRAFYCALQIYQNRKRLNPEDGEVFLSDTEMQQLLGLAISEVTALNDSCAEIHAMRMQSFEETMTLKGQGEVTQDIQAVQIGEFCSFSAEMIRNHILHSPGMREKLKDLETQHRTVQSVSDIVKNMQDIAMLVNRGLHWGLNKQSVEELKTKAIDIGRIYQENKDVIWIVKEDFQEGSNIYTALNKLEEQYGRLDAKFLGRINGIAEKLKTKDPNAPKEMCEKFHEELKEEPKEAVSEYFAAKNIVETFNSKARTVAQILLGEKRPSDITRNPGKLFYREPNGLYQELLKLQKNKEPVEVSVNGTKIRLFKGKDDILFLQSGHKKVALPYNVEKLTEMMTEDVFVNFRKFVPQDAKSIMAKAIERDGYKPGTSRTKYEQFLANFAGITSEELSSLTLSDMQNYMLGYCSSDMNESNLQKVLRERAKYNADQQLLTNSKSAMECLVAMESMEKKQRERELVKSDKEKKNVDYAGEEKEWSPKQKRILHLIGDFFFLETSGECSEKYDHERIKKAILSNADGFRDILDLGKQEKEDFISKFSLFESLSDALKKIFNMIQPLEVVEDPLGEIQSGDNDRMLDAAGIQIETAVNTISEAMQEYLSGAVQDIEEQTEDQWKGIEQLTVEELIQKGMTGEKGEGAFNKEVLSGYIKESNFADKQKMVASFFRNVSYIGSKKIENMNADETDKLVGKYIAGYIKGAGPLLHKMLQGMPISNMPLAMQEAVKDVRSNLTEIDEAFVNAQLHQIIRESKGKIHHIEKVQVLGAASVGQTILIKVYEQGAQQGVEKVVKLLRPDVQSRMNREYSFMDECARKADAKAAKDKKKELPADYVGGIRKTYRNKVEIIRKELDLRLEAKNVEAGKIYEDELLHIRSMRTDATTNKKTDVLILEKAPGVSVDKFLANKDRERKAIIAKITDKKAPQSAYQVLNELNDFRNKLKSKQKYLNNLTCKWLEEALFKSGFFHGDMHSGNIMMDDDGVTVIDYGNAHKFTFSERKDISNLIVAAVRMNTDKFKSYLKGMLSGEAKDLYEAKHETLDKDIRSILKKEDTNDPLLKIFAILELLKNEGIEVPSKFNSFIQSLIRLCGTLMDYDELISRVETDMTEIMESTDDRNIDESPEAPVMPEIMKNILYLHDEKYKDFRKQGQLKTFIDAAFNEKMNVNITPLITFLSDMDRSLGLDGPAFKLNKAESTKGIVRPLYNELVFIRDLVSHNKRLRESVCRVMYDDECVGETLRNYMEVIIDDFNAGISGHISSFIDIYYKKNLKIIKHNDEYKKNRNIWRSMFSKRNELQVKISSVLSNIKNPEYGQKQARDDLTAILDCCKFIALADREDQDERNFLGDTFDMAWAMPYTMNSSDVERQIGFNVELGTKLSEQGELNQSKAKDAALKNLQQSAQTLYLKTESKNYRQKLTETILDQNKFRRMGKELKNWNNGAEGEQLQAAYQAVEKKWNDRQQPTIDEVNALVDAILRCVTARAKEMEKIIIQKNIKDDSLEWAGKKLLWDHWIMMLLYLHVNIPFYIKEHKMGEEEKAKLKKEAKKKHSFYVYNLFNSIESNELKSKMNLLEEAAKGYARLVVKQNPEATKNELQTSVKKYNHAINQFMLALGNLDYSLPGRKRFERLLENYADHPSARTLQYLFSEMHSYIKEQLQDTWFTDDRVIIEGIENPKEAKERSWYEYSYSNKYGNREFLLSNEQLLFVNGNDEKYVGNHIKVNGEKQKTLMDRLKDGEDLQWVVLQSA